MTAVALPEPGFSMAEVSKLTGLHGKYVYELARKGKLKTFCGKDGQMKVSRVELQIFLREREQQSEQE